MTGNRASEAVVLIHGIWMPGWEMSWLGRHFRGCGYTTHFFHYPSLRCPLAYNAERLQRFLLGLPEQTVHMVGHSLGGILVLHLFNRHPAQRSGRVVLLGAPVLGSGVAARMNRLPVLRSLLGSSVDQGLLGGAPAWRGERELGVIAGVLRFGLGSLIGGLEQPSDGTVAVAETRVPGATDFLQVKVSHSGLLFSRQVARAGCRFLREGRF